MPVLIGMSEFPIIYIVQQTKFFVSALGMGGA